MINWLKARRRERIIAQPFPRPSQELLHDRIWQYSQLSVAERDKLHNCIKVMMADKTWGGCDGLQVTDGMRVTITGHAALMLLGTHGYFFDGVREIQIFPQAFDRRTPNDGLYETKLKGGEAWRDGRIVLSRNNVMKTRYSSESGGNIVVHEFAHHLDYLNGNDRGSPLFANSADQKEWADVMNQEFADLQMAAKHGHWTFLRHYGAQNKAEFFAVASECFFEKPTELSRTHTEIYDLLQRLYQIDPLKWVS